MSFLHLFIFFNPVFLKPSQKIHPKYFIKNRTVDVMSVVLSLQHSENVLECQLILWVKIVLENVFICVLIPLN